MSRREDSRRKRRTRGHVIADLGVNFVEKQALLCSYSVQRWLHDYGIDLVLSTYTEEGEIETGFIVLQVKATDRLDVVGGGRHAAVRIDRADLRSWLVDPMPVILILYDAPNDRAYWLYVQSAFSGVRRFRATQGAGTLIVRVPLSQELTRSSILQFRAFRDEVKVQSAGVIHRG